MPDLLLEFLSEEIPARMQARAAEDLRKLVTDRLVAAGLAYEGAQGFRRRRSVLTLSVHGVPARQPDIKEVKRPPRRRTGKRDCGISEGGWASNRSKMPRCSRIRKAISTSR